MFELNHTRGIAVLLQPKPIPEQDGTRAELESKFKKLEDSLKNLTSSGILSTEDSIQILEPLQDALRVFLDSLNSQPEK